MGFISAPAGTLPDFSKAVISLWFRIPQATYAAAIAEANALFFGGEVSNAPWTGVVPLVTWGSGVAAATPGAAGVVQIRPSCIGVVAAIRGPDQYGNAYQGPVTGCCMYARMQYLDGGGMDYAGGAFGECPDYFEVGAYTNNDTVNWGGSGNWDFNPIKQVPITPDVWHHVLISFDLSNGAIAQYTGGTSSVSITYSLMSQFYWAIDDVNYNGGYLGPNTAYPGDAHGPNDIGTAWAGNLITDATGLHVLGTAECIGRPLPAAGYPVSLPAGSAAVAAIKAVDMAEFQMFTGVTLDTSVVANRRAFIDTDGRPVDAVNPNDPQSPPPPPSAPSELLGKSPVISLTRSANNWRSGTNRGYATTKFAPTGKIKPVNPNPKLGT